MYICDSVRDPPSRSSGEAIEGQRPCSPTHQGVEDHNKEVALR